MAEFGVVFEPEVFNTFDAAVEEQRCTPAELAAGVQGIVIAAPQRVRTRSQSSPVLPVCGRYRLEADAMALGAPMQVHLRVKATGRVLSGKAPLVGVVHMDNPPDDEEEAYIPSPGLLIGGAFAFDAQAWLGMQPGRGAYDLWVTQAGATSNVVEVTLSYP